MGNWNQHLKCKKRIYLDPGHGGADDGASVPGNYMFEDELNLSIGLFMDLMLRGLDYECMMSRVKDVAIPLEHRVNEANDWKADVFFSIHNNSYHDYSVKGMGVYVYSGELSFGTLQLATIVNSFLMQNFSKHSQRGIFRENFYVLRKTKMPAILVECEFLSNPEQAEWLRMVENRYLLALSLSQAIHSYFGEVSRTWAERKRILEA